jgi:hypothetical protein
MRDRKKWRRKGICMRPKIYHLRGGARHVRPPLCERVERGMHAQQVLGSSDIEGNNGGHGHGGGGDREEVLLHP